MPARLFPWLWPMLFAAVISMIPFKSAAARTEAEIIDVRTAQEDSAVKVSFAVRNCFTPEMEKAILSGVVTTFRFLAVLEKPGPPLFAEKIVDVSFEHTIRYDRLRNEFVVTQQEHRQKVLTSGDLEEAKSWMSTVQDLSLIPLWRLRKGETYQLALKAELSKVRLPLFFRYIFFFVSLWDFETSWNKTPLTM